MIKLGEALEVKKKELQAIINKTEESAKTPVDVLRISSFRDKTCYYRRPEGAKREQEKYVGTVATPEICALARIDYEKRLYNAACHQKKQLDRIEPFFEDDELVSVYAGMAASRQKLISPIVSDDETYARKWEDYSYSPKPFEEGEPEMYSERGERVRSKSEKIIADFYLKHGIPYRYECPLKLLEGSRFLTFHPDFTVLNKRTRQIFYHEHLGMMDKDDYVARVMWRLDIYEKNGIFPGRQLLLSRETARRPLDMTLIEKMTEIFLI